MRGSVRPGSPPARRCRRCGHSWLSQGGKKPKRCPGCGSYRWDERPAEFACLQCGHSWVSKRGGAAPARCPRCRSSRWDERARICRCNVCGYEWRARKHASRPYRCPGCRSSVWSSKRGPETAAKGRMERSKAPPGQRRSPNLDARTVAEICERLSRGERLYPIVQDLQLPFFEVFVELDKLNQKFRIRWA